MHIVQIAPTIGSGAGVSGVAWELDREFTSLGHTVERFTLASAGYRRTRPLPNSRVLGAFAIFRRMVWFSTVGTVRAKRFLAARPGAVSICHNNVMTGDIYVNHGVAIASLQARGHMWRRILANPTHLFTFVRDLIRYRSGIHRAVVALAPSEVEVLRRVYGRIRPPVHVIPNGVDLERFHPPSAEERAAARAQFHLDDEDRVVLFIGHEFRRKGLAHAIDALVHAPTVLLLVVGGRADTLAEARAHADRAGVAERVLFAGVRTDLPVLFAASDIFVLPSAYEAYGLVLLEALAAGLPVVATRVGSAPSLIENGVNGYLVDASASEIGDRFEELAAADLDGYRQRARKTAERHGWREAAERYVALLEEIAAR